MGAGSLPPVPKQKGGEITMNDHGSNSMNFVIERDLSRWKVRYDPGQSMQATSHEMQQFVFWAAPRVEEYITELLKEKFPETRLA